MISLKQQYVPDSNGVRDYGLVPVFRKNLSRSVPPYGAVVSARPSRLHFGRFHYSNNSAETTCTYGQHVGVSVEQSQVGGRMIFVRFQISLPPETWVAQVSHSFPTATFRLLSGIRTGDIAIELGEVITSTPETVARAIDSHPSVVRHEQLERTDKRLLSKYETMDIGLYEFVERSSLPPEFPIVVRDGWYEFDLTGTRTEFDRFRAELAAAEQPYELLSIVETERNETLLSARQWELLEHAVQQGYFEVPRECTLAELSADFEIDKSTASEILRRGEARLVKWFLTGATHKRLE